MIGCCFLVVLAHNEMLLLLLLLSTPTRSTITPKSTRALDPRRILTSRVHPSRAQ